MEAKPLTAELPGQKMFLHAFSEAEGGATSILVSWPDAPHNSEQKVWFHSPDPFPEDFLIQVITAISGLKCVG